MFSARLTISQRIQIGLVFAMAFLLVLGSNRLDERHFSTIQETVNSVYKDRVVVQDLIYKLDNFFHKKQLRFLQGEATLSDPSENKQIETLLANFRDTKLTPEESDFLSSLKEGHFALLDLKTRFPKNEESPAGAYKKEVSQAFQNIERDLDGLAAIQLSESALLTQLSNKSLGMNILLSKLEVAFLIIIGVAMLFLVFRPVEKESTTPEGSPLD